MADSGMVELSTLLFEMLLAPTTQVILKNGFQDSAMEVCIGAIVRQPPMIHKAYSEAEQSLYHGALRLVVPQLEIANRLPIFNVANAQVPLTSLPRLAETADTLDQMTYAGVN